MGEAHPYGAELPHSKRNWDCVPKVGGHWKVAGHPKVHGSCPHGGPRRLRLVVGSRERNPVWIEVHTRHRPEDTQLSSTWCGPLEIFSRTVVSVVPWPGSVQRTRYASPQFPPWAGHFLTPRCASFRIFYTSIETWENAERDQRFWRVHAAKDQKQSIISFPNWSQICKTAKQNVSLD